ncbi:MAG TPA: hypothetical protein VGZ93_00930, partial [Candidatus Methylacidiphilales bacterium]|nr:hypothetical protein [Candidatus Methylacidiphilales bacterium]
MLNFQLPIPHPGESALARHTCAATQDWFFARAWGLLEWETPHEWSGTAMQFARVISRAENMEIWNANGSGFSFVISY